ncbi:MAG: YSC84-related protein [Neptuniibacter sp.]
MYQRLTSLVFILFLSLAVTQVHAASNAEINAKSAQALKEFFKHSPAGKQLYNNAKGALIFPEVFKAGIGIGGEYGEGKLVERGKTTGYYSIAAASIGFQLGAQIKTEIILFMTNSALRQFKNSEGWEAGVDGSVALVTLGAGKEIDTSNIKDPIIGFIFSNKGLMYNLSLEGSKISKK